MRLPPTSHAAMLQAIQLFRAGERSPQGPKVDDDWLGNGNHHDVIVHAGEPYPVKEIIRLAVHAHTAAWPERFMGGPTQANRYARAHGMTVTAKTDWQST